MPSNARAKPPVTSHIKAEISRDKSRGIGYANRVQNQTHNLTGGGCSPEVSQADAITSHALSLAEQWTAANPALPLQVTAPAKAKRKTSAERQAARRERLGAAGLVPLTVYVPRVVLPDWIVAAGTASEVWKRKGLSLIPRLVEARTGKLHKGGAW